MADQSDWKARAQAHLLWPEAGAELPIVVAGNGSIVLDIEGREYIDCVAGPSVLAFGHCHPKIIAAIQEQVHQLAQGVGSHLNVPAIELAEKLAGISPGKLDKVFFCNSGAEANDGAIKLAMKYLSKKGRRGGAIAILERSFHGRLALPLSLSSQPSMKVGLEDYADFPNIVRLPAPYCYRCPFPLDCAECGVRCAAALEEAIQAENVSIFICEPILGVGGIVVPPDEYLPKVVEICREHEVLVIFDEVYTGFGRTGRMFAYEHWDCVPDIMTVAKALGGGLPLGAIVVNEKIADALDSNDHYTTFGGNNALTCAAGLVALEVLEEENLVQKAEERGAYFLNRLQAMMEEFEFIGEVRGKGLFIGVELVEDRRSKKPASHLARAVVSQMQKRGVLVQTHGDEKCVVRLSPPLVIQQDQIDTVLNALAESFQEVTKSGVEASYS